MFAAIAGKATAIDAAARTITAAARAKLIFCIAFP
jgi:hypothetical protein